jgi:hypothetical protein
MERQSRMRRILDGEVTNLLLFPKELSPLAEHTLRTDDCRQPESSLRWNSLVSLSRITAEWPALLKRLGQHHRALETILAAGRPIRLTDHTLIIGFPPHRRFHQELLDMPDYRACVEDELSRTFRVRLAVATSLHPESRTLRRHRESGNTSA